MPKRRLANHDKSHQGTDIQRKGIKDIAINNTFLRRCLTLLALKTTARFYSPDGVVIPISKHCIVKHGPMVDLTEAATMKFVAEHTSIPVPKVYCSFNHKKCAYIVMERIQEQVLPLVWGKMPAESRANVVKQLKHMFEELRAQKTPVGTEVESCVGGSLRDARLPRSRPRFGPFKTIQEFHLWLRDGLKSSEVANPIFDKQDWKEIKDMADHQDGIWPSPVFTHGDLNPYNILIRGENVVGIIDWEFSGWYPPYWEYTSGSYGRFLDTDWQGTLEKFIDPYPAELQMETTRQKWRGIADYAPTLVLIDV
jgi:serine/threonine protein kinase